MRVGEKQYKAMPVELQALFVKLPNPGSDEVLGMFPVTTSGYKKAGTPYNHDNCITMGGAVGCTKRDYPGDSGSAARFFYCAKASKKEKNEGLPEGVKNSHPTVKPISLMRYLCKLITPPSGLILDPFAGSGSTLVAAVLEGFDCIGIELEEESFETAVLRAEGCEKDD